MSSRICRTRNYDSAGWIGAFNSSPRWRFVIRPMSLRAFAAEHEVTPQRLYAWRRRIAVGDRTTFEEVLVRPTRVPFPSDGAPFDVTLTSGIVVRVPPSFHSASLARLLDALVQARAC